MNRRATFLSMVVMTTMLHAGEPTILESTTHGTDAHEGELDHDGRFHFTTLRAWAYTETLEGSSDTKKLGFEFNSAWSWGNWDVSNITYAELADYPRSVPGLPAGSSNVALGAGTGLTDTLTAFLFSRRSNHHSRHHFSYGFAAQLPTASEKSLGSGKWAVGPAIDYEYTNGRFFGAFVALQLWDIAGDSSRKSVNYMMIKPMITYALTDHWKAVYMPYGITSYWSKLPGDDLYVPLGGGFQYDWGPNGHDMAVSLQAFKYVVRPTKGAEYDYRLMFEYNF